MFPPTVLGEPGSGWSWRMTKCKAMNGGTGYEDWSACRGCDNQPSGGWDENRFSRCPSLLIYKGLNPVTTVEPILKAGKRLMVNEMGGI